MYRRARVIYNATAGREVFQRYLPSLLERLEHADYEASCHVTAGKGDATEAARRAVERRHDLIVAVGGDGTVHEVVNGVAGQPYRPKLGIIPAGTANDFASALRIPRDFDAAFDVLVGGIEEKVDIGKANDRYFINIAGGGALTEVSYEVHPRLKTMLGQLAYYVRGIEKLTLLKPTRVHIEAPGRDIDEEIMLFLVANGNSVGGFERLAPYAKMNDGYFDVLVVKKTTLTEVIKLATAVLRGEHINDPRVIYFQAPELQVRSRHSVMINLDGELGGELPCKFTVLHQHITVMVPPQDMADNAQRGQASGFRVHGTEGFVVNTHLPAGRQVQ